MFVFHLVPNMSELRLIFSQNPPLFSCTLSFLSQYRKAALKKIKKKSYRNFQWRSGTGFKSMLLLDDAPALPSMRFEREKSNYIAVLVMLSRS